MTWIWQVDYVLWRSHLHWNCGHVMYILEGNMTSGVRQTYNLLWKRWNRFKQFHFRSVLLTQTNWQWHLVRHFLYNCIHYCYTVVLCLMSKMVDRVWFEKKKQRQKGRRWYIPVLTHNNNTIISFFSILSGPESLKKV